MHQQWSLRHRFHVPSPIIAALSQRIYPKAVMSLTYRALRSLHLQLNHCELQPPFFINLPVLRHPFHNSSAMASPLKRKAEKRATSPKKKKQKIEIPEYHLTPSRRDDDGEIVWPAPKAQIERAREIIREWFVLIFSITLDPSSLRGLYINT